MADRYGGSGGAHQGGSGRCGMDGLFNAKGIGRTPLVADNVDWGHSHGCLWLADAVREVINAEVAAAELPYGGVPVIAIIDTGVILKHEGGADRRAIIVRPNFIRPAHFERSIFFGCSGTTTSEQYIDALRTQHAIATMTTTGGDKCAANIKFDGLKAMFLRYATQIGHSRAHRLWQGRFLTSNLSIEGALVDFGSFRAVPSWRRATGEVGEAFGDEMRGFNSAIDSLCFYFRKYAPNTFDVPNTKALIREVESSIEGSFGRACIDALLLDSAADPHITEEIAQLFSRYFKVQQRETIDIGKDKRAWRRPWLFDALVGRRDAPSAERAVARTFRDILSRTSGGAGISAESAVGVGMCAARRWLRPRPLLYYETAAPRTRSFVKYLTGDANSDADRIARYIESCVSKSRRVWRGVPRCLDIVGQVTNLYSSALYCFDSVSVRGSVWIEGRAMGSDVRVFNQRIPWEDIESMCPTCDGAIVRFLVPIQNFDFQQDLVVQIGSKRMRIPRPSFVYPAGSSD